MLVARETSPRHLHSKTLAPVKVQRITAVLFTHLLKCKAICRKNAKERKRILHNLEKTDFFSFFLFIPGEMQYFPFYTPLDQSKMIPQAHTDKVIIHRFSITGH